MVGRAPAPRPGSLRSDRRPAHRGHPSGAGPGDGPAPFGPPAGGRHSAVFGREPGKNRRPAGGGGLPAPGAGPGPGIGPGGHRRREPGGAAVQRRLPSRAPPSARGENDLVTHAHTAQNKMSRDIYTGTYADDLLERVGRADLGGAPRPRCSWTARPWASTWGWPCWCAWWELAPRLSRCCGCRPARVLTGKE